MRGAQFEQRVFEDEHRKHREPMETVIVSQAIGYPASLFDTMLRRDNRPLQMLRRVGAHEYLFKVTSLVV